MNKFLLLAFVCVLTLPGPIFAAIVYSGSQNVTLQLSPMNPMSMMTIDIAGQHDGGNEWDDFTINLEYEMVPGTMTGMTRLTILGGMGAMDMGHVIGYINMTGMNIASNLGLGTTIGSSSHPVDGQEPALLLEAIEGGQIRIGEFGEEGGYIGLTMPGSTYYGWLHLSEMSDIGLTTQSFKIDGWAYEDVPGTSIVAGDTGVIPAPGAFVLGGLGIGLVTWLRRRRAV